MGRSDHGILNSVDGNRWVKGIYFEAHISSFRFTHVINGRVDFAVQAHRPYATIKGLGKRECVITKRPCNTDLIRRTHRELVEESASCGIGYGSMYLRLYAARVLIFLSFANISIRSLNLGRCIGRRQRWWAFLVYTDQAIANRYIQRRIDSALG